MSPTLWTPICDAQGIRVPIFGFSHCVETVAAISLAGGMGVYGATRRFPDEIRRDLAEIPARLASLPSVSKPLV